ncbi:hypothetical protein HanRHA438_Chr05g0241591 [Helianthus annuus]|nr:hypothetical protein HanRHA438_Chr05g0241591 [Helianthus annuus]
MTFVYVTVIVTRQPFRVGVLHIPSFGAPKLIQASSGSADKEVSLNIYHLFKLETKDFFGGCSFKKSQAISTPRHHLK